MNKPKEKAYELVDKLYQTIPNENYLNDPIGVERYEAWQQSKQCALIAVDELINATLPSSDFGGDINTHTIEYWQEVKQEIEKL